MDIEKKRVEGEIELFPDLLNRPNRPPYAPMRTSPISNILTHSNYFSVLAVAKKKNQELESTHALSSIAIAPTIQVIPIPETRHYNAIGIDQNGHRLSDFKPVWSVEKEDGKGTIDQDGSFKADKDGIVFTKAHQGENSKKMITFLGTCTWCHYFGRR